MDPENFNADFARLFDTMRRRKGACPDADVLIAHRNDELAAAQRRQLEEHLLLCAPCSELLDRLRQSAEPVDELKWRQVERRLRSKAAPWRAPSKPKGGRWPLRRYWMGAAAAVAIAVGLFLSWGIRSSVSIPSGPPSVTRGEILQLHEPAGVVSGVRTFTWSSIPISSKFRLQIRRQGRIIWEGTADEPRYRPPSELTALLVVGERFEWRVEALDDAGNPLAESSWMSFELSR